MFSMPFRSLNLISISQLFDSGFDVIFSYSNCIVQELHLKKSIGTTCREGALYVLEEFHIPGFAAFSLTSIDLSSFRLNPEIIIILFMEFSFVSCFSFPS